MLGNFSDIFVLHGCFFFQHFFTLKAIFDGPHHPPVFDATAFQQGLGVVGPAPEPQHNSTHMGDHKFMSEQSISPLDGCAYILTSRLYSIGVVCTRKSRKIVNACAGISTTRIND